MQKQSLHDIYWKKYISETWGQSCSFWNQNWEDIVEEKGRSKQTSCNSSDILILNESNLRWLFLRSLFERIKFNLIFVIPKRPISYAYSTFTSQTRKNRIKQKFSSCYHIQGDPKKTEPTNLWIKFLILVIPLFFFRLQ